MITMKPQKSESLQNPEDPKFDSWRRDTFFQNVCHEDYAKAKTFGGISSPQNYLNSFIHINLANFG